MLDNALGHFYSATKSCVKALLLGLRNEVRATGTHIRVSVSTLKVTPYKVTPVDAKANYTSTMYVAPFQFCIYFG